jgi:hypothetical protein
VLTETYKAKAVIEEDVVAAIAALMTDPTPSPFVMGHIYVRDPLPECHTGSLSTRMP